MAARRCGVGWDAAGVVTTSTLPTRDPPGERLVHARVLGHEQRDELTVQRVGDVPLLGRTQLTEQGSQEPERAVLGRTVARPQDDRDQILLGFVVDLEYADATTSAHDLLQTFKLHPLVKKILEGGERVAWGAKALPGGGYWSMPKLTMPGALLVGDAAGLVDTVSLKGVHHSILSGKLAAGDPIITEGLDGLRPGATVQVAGAGGDKGNSEKGAQAADAAECERLRRTLGERERAHERLLVETKDLRAELDAMRQRAQVQQQQQTSVRESLGGDVANA